MVLGLLVGNCAPSEKGIYDARMKYSTQQPYALCMDYLSYPDWNQYQPYRADAIEARGIDCSPWAEQAYALKRKKEDERTESLKKVFNAGVDTVYGTSERTVDGRKMVCTTQRIGTSGMAKTTCREK